ncbi:hypothetical protein M8A51_23270 [Schlegelella sp. S2-27]|uniref:DUF4136 domain-containing protein n=1 Tax=Caldimonas mangrovi TaxID=2944811 RepID=A0ABT0YUM9_9BURK|nr:hypothetical protein [Caldimonas mangrovi]MCM5682460.1 hypothetical protein [Caldimonas mangrovi]
MKAISSGGLRASSSPSAPEPTAAASKADGEHLMDPAHDADAGWRARRAGVLALWLAMAPVAGWCGERQGEQVNAQATAGLTHARLDRVKRLILQAGARCTYSSKYNHNPCLQIAGFHLYLNPDPGPDGHPQWNLDSDPAIGDFHTLVVRRRSGEDGWGSVQFMPGRDLVVSSFGEPSAEAAARARGLLEAAVAAVLNAATEPGEAPAPNVEP